MSVFGWEGDKTVETSHEDALDQYEGEGKNCPDHLKAEGGDALAEDDTCCNPLNEFYQHTNPNSGEKRPHPGS